MRSIAERSLELTSLFEAEVFIQLMLKRWDHPFAEDVDFANSLLEDASNALRDALGGIQLMENLPAPNLNFVAAVWYAEHSSVEVGGADSEMDPQIIEARKTWLASVRHALPSCFCDPSDLQQL